MRVQGQTLRVELLRLQPLFAEGLWGSCATVFPNGRPWSLLRAGAWGRSRGDTGSDNVAEASHKGCGCLRVKGEARRGCRSCLKLSRPLCTRGRSQVQVWSVKLGSPPSPGSPLLLFFLSFFPLSGKALALRGGVRDTHLSWCTLKSSQALFSPAPEELRMPASGLAFGLRRGGGLPPSLPGHPQENQFPRFVQ